MGEHTPGPWRYHLGRGAAQRFHVQTTAGYQVASTPEINRHETREADARLIAAAPELLAALRRAKATLEEVSGTFADPVSAFLARELNETIAKAEGRN